MNAIHSGNTKTYSPAPGRARCAAKGAHRCRLSPSGNGIAVHSRSRPASSRLSQISCPANAHGSALVDRNLGGAERTSRAGRYFQNPAAKNPLHRERPASLHRRFGNRLDELEKLGHRNFQTATHCRPHRSAGKSHAAPRAHSSTKTTAAVSASRSSKQHSHPRRPPPRSRPCSSTTNVLPA